MTKADWTNILNCMIARREAEGLCGHWSDHLFSDRFNELMRAEFMVRMQVISAPA